MEQEKRCWEDDQVIIKAFSKIELQSVLKAANRLRKAGEDLPQYPYTCMYVSSAKKSYKFYTEDNAYPFCFIINKYWLLFYLRGSAVRNNLFNFNELKRVFPTIKENNLGEWNFQVTNEKDATYIIENILNKWL